MLYWDSRLSKTCPGIKSWEPSTSFCKFEQIIHILDAGDNACFYATHGGAELDLLINYKGKRYGFEFKYMDSPGTTKSMTVVLEDLKLEGLYVVYPGQRSFPLKDGIELLPGAGPHESPAGRIRSTGRHSSD